MSLNKLENDILNLVNRKNIDVRKVNELFKSGANPNALSNDEVETFNSCSYYSTFFSECIFESQENTPDLFPLLKCFIENGLDVNKYGPSIIGDFHFIHGNSDIYKMTKYMLNHMDKNNPVEQALDSIGTEESYYNCSLKNDFASNELASIYELIKAFSKGNEFNNIYSWKTIIGEKVKEINISGTNCIIDDNTFICSSLNSEMKTLIECESNKLYILDNDIAFVNNSALIDNKSKKFSKYLTDNLKGEVIENVCFEHTEFIDAPRSYIQDRNIIISFSNNKKILYKYLINEKQFAIMFVNTTDKNILLEYTDVFVENEYNILDKNMNIVIPDMTGKFKIFHNCDVNKGARYSFSFINYYNDKLIDDYINVDEESFEILRPYINKYIPDFDQYDNINPIKDCTYVKLQNEIISLIDDLEKDNTTKKYIECVYNSKMCLDGFSYDDKMYLEYRFKEIKPIIIKFLKAFVWYIGEYHGYTYCNDDKLLNISGY